MSENVIVEKKARVARVTLNRPEVRNAFDDALIAALGEALRSLDADPEVRAVVLGGAGAAFCAGADLNWMRRMAGYSFEENRADGLALVRGQGAQPFAAAESIIRARWSEWGVAKW